MNALVTKQVIAYLSEVSTHKKGIIGPARHYSNTYLQYTNDDTRHTITAMKIPRNITSSQRIEELATQKVSMSYYPKESRIIYNPPTQADKELKKIITDITQTLELLIKN